VSGNFKRTDAHSGNGGGFLQRHLPQFKHFHSGSLRGGKAVDRILQFFLSKHIFCFIRVFASKGYVQAISLHFPYAGSGITARSICKAVSSNCEKPGHEWSPRIVSGSDRMQGEQDILNEIFNILVGQKTSTSTHNTPQANCDFLQ